MKKKIKIYMLHPSIHSVDSLYRYLNIHSYNDLKYEFVWDEAKPDYFIASEHIWRSYAFWKKFVKIYHKAKINIYYAGECNAPDLNIFDYAICFDKHLKCDDRLCRIPTRLFFENLIFDNSNCLSGRTDRIREELEKKTEFCNFMYSNANGHAKRKEIFYKISEYKKVDSLGRYLNNKKIPMEAKNQNGWGPVIKESIEIKRKYKFSIAFENACYAGYTSEKILSSLAAHTVPIYWGNPLIAEEFNERAFINCHKYKDFDDVLEQIKRIDQEDEMWCEMVSQPWTTPEQEIKEKEDIEKYYGFLENIFLQPIESAKRVAEGCFPDIYHEFFFHSREIFPMIKAYIFYLGGICKKTLRKALNKYNLWNREQKMQSTT